MSRVQRGPGLLKTQETFELTLYFEMSLRPEWINVSTVDLSETEKAELEEFCLLRKLKCRCNEVDQTGHKCQYFCLLCNDIVNRPEPSFLLDNTLFTVRQLFESESYKRHKAMMKFLIV